MDAVSEEDLEDDLLPVVPPDRDSLVVSETLLDEVKVVKICGVPAISS